MTYTLRDTTDAGRVWVGGAVAGQSAEETHEHNYESLADAIKHYEKVVDWGFAGWERTVSIIDAAGETLTTKTFKVPNL
jgi:hypothetical protein